MTQLPRASAVTVRNYRCFARRSHRARSIQSGSRVPMVVITVASRKGGSGKSTLTANLAAFADKASRRCLLIDADPQGSLSLWHDLRKSGEPPFRPAARGRENHVAP